MILPISSWSMGPSTPGPLAEGRLAWAAPGWIRGRLATVVAGGGSCAASPLLRWPSLPFRGSWCWGGCPPPRLVAPVQLGQPFRVPSWSEEPHIGRQCGRVAPPHATEVAFFGLLRHRTRVDVVQRCLMEFTGRWYSPSWWCTGHDSRSSSSVCVDGWFILGCHDCSCTPGVQPHPARVQSV